ncbi:hypothetical protein Syun_026923 [Stephania yunnanensis]|uniref:CSC1-like protein At4g02900 n=1 Tax=Stephania yunnanensis TaxID=152371 RepID=A0AAP0EJQ3_9MAGN
MATLEDIGMAAAINILSAFAFFLAFSVLRVQPINDRVYFPKWYLKGLRCSPFSSGAFVGRFLNLDYRSYLRFLGWMPAALRMPEPELVEHAGLDSVVYLRIYLLGIKIFVPITFLAFAILVPVNWTNGTLEHSNVIFNDIDKLSISNVPTGSKRFWTHLVIAYAITFWTCYLLRKEYDIVATMRLHFLATEQRRPDQFTVLVRNVPPDPHESVSEHVEHFFLVNHPDYYLTHQVVYNANKLAELVKKKKKMQNWLDYYELKYSRNPSRRPTTKIGFLGLTGDTVDSIAFYSSEIEKVTIQIKAEEVRIKKDTRSVMPTAFVSFKTRWAAAVCAQTQQFRNPTLWLTEWSPEPRDIYWDNLAIPFVSLSIRKLVVATDKDQEEAMDPGSLGFNTCEPRIQLYFLLGLVYAAVTPIVLPFILAFFCLAYVVFRHQIINVYNQEYESAAAFWPDVHRRIITALIISQLLLMGLLSTKKAEKSTPILVALPVLTLFFHKYCKTRFEPAFSKYPLQEVMMKDTLERTREPNLNLKDYLRNAYIHPVFKGGEDGESLAVMEEWEQVSLVATKRQSRKNTPQHSNYSGSSASLLLS